MDPLQLLKNDHEKVKDLFERYDLIAEDDYGSKQEIARQIFEEAEAHMDVEEEIFYPAVENAGQDDMVSESIAEHEIVKGLINDLRDMAPDDAEYAGKMKAMQESVEHHIREEEDNMFPFAQENLQEQWDDLGAEMADLKKEIKEAEFIR